MYAKDLRPEKLTRSVSSADLWCGPEFWAKFPKAGGLVRCLASGLGEEFLGARVF